VFTEPFPATPEGDARVRTTVELPNPCVAPTAFHCRRHRGQVVRRRWIRGRRRGGGVILWLGAVGGWLPCRLITQRHRPRAEFQPAHELQVDVFR
jgi:hypothetical protein